MKKVFLLLFVAIAPLLGARLAAQISHGGEPSFNNTVAKMKSAAVEFPLVDNARYIDEDLAAVKGAGPMRIGVVQYQNVDVLRNARVVKDAQGDHYLMAVTSQEASFLSLHFSEFRLADGATLFFYDEDGATVLGSFNDSDVKEDGSFYTQALPGSTAYLEYNVPAGTDPGSLVLDHICHGYKDMFRSIAQTYDDIYEASKGQLGDAVGNCHINVACSEASDWRNQIRSVVAIQIVDQLYAYMCSGAVINNTRQDRTPYVLTAFHCQDVENAPVRYYTAYFLYQSANCSGTLGGTINNSITGATEKAKYSYNGGSDMLLLQLSHAIPDSYKPYYAGWDRSSATTHTPGVCIHHPGGDIKKISFAKSIVKGTGAEKNFFVVSWFTGNENKGVTEQGSSGSPLFNADKRIVGQLYAGYSECTYPQGNDVYGRVFTSWLGGGADNSSLQPWLDPDNTDVTTLDGLNFQDEVGIDLPEGRRFYDLTVYPNPSNGLIHFDVDEIGDANYKVFDLSGRCVKEGRTVLTTTSQAVDLRTLPAGTYVMNLYTSFRSYSTTLLISK